MDITRERLIQERKNWRKEHPHGFIAKPCKDPKTGSSDLYEWDCLIPGKKGSDWEGGNFRLIIQFPEEYPNKPPKCVFKPVLFHPNIYPSGTVCLSILNEDEDWKPSISIAQILLGIQELLANPNPSSPAQADPYLMLTTKKKDYVQKVREQVRTIGKKF
ncbi:unnamed protein product [Moneuplotes crassus]|uniref:SUMO-conjugating enzyme UBC9 n=1 Tax=Euplotes crassus TaxID=5936 RepID=A0AAD2D7K2_EUPCR|nr:unnamed protein product [Moneuplotes crassus]